MGIDCSKNVPKINRNTVAPKPNRAPQPPQTKNSTTTIAHGVAPPSPRKKPPAPQPKHPVTNIKPSTKPVNNIKPHTNPVNNIKSPIKPVPNDIKILDRSSTPTFIIAPIDTNSIIFDRSDENLNASGKRHTATKRPPISRSSSVDSSSDRSVHSEPKLSIRNLNRFFKSNINLTASNASSSDNNLNFMRFYHRLSDGVQTLFNGNLSAVRKRNMSASDTNLSVPYRRSGGGGGVNSRSGTNRGCMLSQQQLIDNDYCPSVLYNRKARKSCSDRDIDKSQTFQRWKQQIWMKFSRRKQQTSTRKTYVLIYFFVISKY